MVYYINTTTRKIGVFKTKSEAIKYRKVVLGGRGRITQRKLTSVSPSDRKWFKRFG